MPESERRGRATIGDIARNVGVSKSTVSRALSGHVDIGYETRQRVASAAKDLGYVRSVSGRALRTGRFSSFGLLVPVDVWPWFSELERGAAEEAMRLGYTLVLHPLGDSEDAERDFAERVMPSLPIDGLVLVMPEGMFPHIGDLARHGLPVVLIDDRREIEEFPSVLAANRDGAKAATAHLLHVGRRQVACVMGPLKHLYARERLEGYRAAFDEAGVAHAHELVVGDEDEEPGAAEAVSTLLSRGVGFDALFACHDEMAAELLGALRAAGLSVPKDVAVVGFDDIPPARFMYPALTTVRQPLYEMGATAVRMLHDAIEHRSRRKSVVLPTELVIRESCGATETRAGQETQK